MHKIKLFAHLFLLGGLLMLSCNNQKESSVAQKFENTNFTDTTEFTIYTTGNTMYDMAFEPNVIYTKPNTFIQVKLINKGADTMMIHNILFVQKGKADEIGVKALRAGPEKQYIPDHPAVIAASQLMQPLDSVQVIFPAPPPGTYPFICSYPGHYLKMRGRLVIK